MTLLGFVEFFDSIPDKNWTTGTLQDDHGAKCALGHLGGWLSPLSIELAEIFHNHLNPIWDDACEHTLLVADINDGAGYVYDKVLIGDGPKQRILNLLYDIAKKQNILFVTRKKLNENERQNPHRKRRSNNTKVRSGDHSHVH